MKFLIAFALFAVASASVIPPAIVASTDPEIQEILAAINSPSTDPATAAALEQLLLDILGVEPVVVAPEPIAIGPALVDNPISVGPALIDFPLPDGGAVTAVDPTPVMPAPVAPGSAPLVQIILNIKSSSDVSIENLPVGSPAGFPVQVIDNSPVAEPIVPEPVIVVEQPIAPEPVIIVDKPIAPEAVIVVDKPTAPEAVIVVDKPTVPEGVIIVDKPIMPEGVVVVDKPQAPESVIVAQPIIPVPAIVLPDTLN